MRIISFTTILGGVALFLSFTFRRVSAKGSEKRVKDKLKQSEGYRHLSNDVIDQLVKITPPTIEGKT
jgi:hypothetical protein